MRRMLSSLLLAAALLAQPQVAAAAKTLAVGDPAPEVVGKDRDGAPIRLEDSRGKVVVLSFWASWCPPCRRELPILENVQRQGADHIKVIAINYKEDAALMRKLLAKATDAQMTYTRDPDGALARRFGLKVLPLLVMIGRDGRIANIHAGYSETGLNRILDELNRLLAAPATAQGTP